VAVLALLVEGALVVLDKLIDPAAAPAAAVSATAPATPPRRRDRVPQDRVNDRPTQASWSERS
jgi:hypothetical protein